MRTWPTTRVAMRPNGLATILLLRCEARIAALTPTIPRISLVDTRRSDAVDGSHGLSTGALCGGAALVAQLVFTRDASAVSESAHDQPDSEGLERPKEVGIIALDRNDLGFANPRNCGSRRLEDRPVA